MAFGPQLTSTSTTLRYISELEQARTRFEQSEALAAWFHRSSLGRVAIVETDSPNRCHYEWQDGALQAVSPEADSLHRLGSDLSCRVIDGTSCGASLHHLDGGSACVLAVPLTDGPEHFGLALLAIPNRQFDQNQVALAETLAALYVREAKKVGQSEKASDRAPTPTPSLRGFSSAISRVPAFRGNRERLREALYKGEIFAAFQPVVDLSKSQITSIEATARWRSRSSIKAAAEFFPSQDALARSITERVVTEAGSFVEGYVHRVPDGLRPSMSVNVEARHVSEISSLIEDLYPRVDPHLMVMEFHADDAALVDAAASCSRDFVLDDVRRIETLDAVVDQTHLQGAKLPMDISHTMVEDLGVRESVRRIVHHAHRDGKWVGVKGIETLDQLDVARQLGVDLAQGFFLFPPGDITEVKAILDRQRVRASSSHLSAEPSPRRALPSRCT